MSGRYLVFKSTVVDDFIACAVFACADFAAPEIKQPKLQSFESGDTPWTVDCMVGQQQGAKTCSD